MYPFAIQSGLLPNHKATHPQRRTACGLVEVDVDAFQLQVALAAVGAGRVDTMFVADNL